MTKGVNFISDLSYLRWTFSQVVRVPAYISTIISAAADLEAIASSVDEGPGEMMCFPAGLHYLITFPTRLSKISQKSMCLYANLSEKGCVSCVLKRTVSTKCLLFF